MSQLLKVGEVARYLQVRRPTIYQWIRDGRIPALRVGTRWRFRKEDINRWMEMESALNNDAAESSQETAGKKSRDQTRRGR